MIARDVRGRPWMIRWIVPIANTIPRKKRDPALGPVHARLRRLFQRDIICA
jgi:hypothetical protein